MTKRIVKAGTGGYRNQPKQPDFGNKLADEYAWIVGSFVNIEHLKEAINRAKQEGYEAGWRGMIKKVEKLSFTRKGTPSDYDSICVFVKDWQRLKGNPNKEKGK